MNIKLEDHFFLYTFLISLIQILLAQLWNFTIMFTIMLIVVKKVHASKLGQKSSIVHINDAIRKVTMFLKNELNFVKMSHGAITWRKNIFMKNRPNLIENDTICSVVLSSLIGDRTIWFCCCLLRFFLNLFYVMDLWFIDVNLGLEIKVSYQ